MNTSILPVSIKARHIVEPRIDIYFPQLTSLTNKTIEKQLNERIETQVYRMIRKQGYLENKDLEITGGFDVKNNQQNIFSVTNSHYSYSKGAAHGLTMVRSLTMDVELGKVYTLRELFKKDAPYQKKINEQINLQIKERKMDLLNEFKGIHPNQFFYVADKTLVIYFQLYDLQAYVYGLTYFPISIYLLQDILDEDGPLGKLLY
ncbi:DUF3298 and DUF4163 domain-containing protein [Alkalihalobacillus trypoxylicola]|uniref:DUF3298 domain-containing protein n=1 Tax=Alkalihalobacillus trypoxylicola TaxID=519424 RepID=A0A162DMY8_9BACI|nr:DUF3298 and DUF4163 domain-containing protein [Alkalihalobacillus trypoxylicola]KYG30359.1 hypothetical protein AZF04_19940 [Alkalihalobacillus trypoxylicola]GAF66946.1 hypothetical protein BTS2_3852 [Bacillus sp. TS-2]